MNRITKGVLCVLIACVSMYAQSTAQIHGTVRDASGAAVPGAEVKAIQTETSLTRTVTSEADGGYVLASLPTGPYRIEEIGRAHV